MHCLSGSCKMTFTIHLIFTFLAGIIFTPLFTTLCSCYMFCNDLSHKNHPFHVKNMVLHLMLYDFLSQKNVSCICCNFVFIPFLHHLPHSMHGTYVYVFLKFKIILLKLSTWTASWSFVRWPLRFTSSSHSLQV